MTNSWSPRHFVYKFYRGFMFREFRTKGFRRAVWSGPYRRSTSSLIPINCTTYVPLACDVSSSTISINENTQNNIPIGTDCSRNVLRTFRGELRGTFLRTVNETPRISPKNVLRTFLEHARECSGYDL